MVDMSAAPERARASGRQTLIDGYDLVAALDRAAGNQVTIVSAPTGSGKPRYYAHGPTDAAGRVPVGTAGEARRAAVLVSAAGRGRGMRQRMPRYSPTSSTSCTGASPAAKEQSSLPPTDELSPGELRVLRYLPTNLSRPEIARELSVSVHTVSTHIRSTKLQIRDGSSAVPRGNCGCWRPAARASPAVI